MVCYANEIRRECVKLIFRFESTNKFHEPVCLSQALLSFYSEFLIRKQVSLFPQRRAKLPRTPRLRKNLLTN